MKVCALPAEVPAPKIDFAKEQAAEKAHQKALKAHLIGMGYTGKNTGRIFRISYADGYAQYMYMDGPNGRGAALVVLPYGDAWDSPTVRGLTKSYVLKEIERGEKIEAFLARRVASGFQDA